MIFIFRTIQSSKVNKAILKKTHHIAMLKNYEFIDIKTKFFTFLQYAHHGFVAVICNKSKIQQKTKYKQNKTNKSLVSSLFQRYSLMFKQRDFPCIF